jgi:hypothetical protein
LEDFMKKFLAICIIGLSLGSASVFADHPDGWGIGIMGRGGWGYGDGGSPGGVALSLKAPMLPIYWGINLGFGSRYFGFGITGDYYFKEGVLAPISGTDGLGYFIGVGGYLEFGTWSGGTYYWNEDHKWHDWGWTYLGLGVRVPLGLNLVIPVSSIKLELFLDIAPNLGLKLFFLDETPGWTNDHDTVGLGFGFTGEIGIRIWF